MGRFAWLKTILEIGAQFSTHKASGSEEGCHAAWRQSRPSQSQSRTTEASASVKACGWSTPEQALSQF